MTGLLDVLSQAFHAIMGATSRNARITILDECTLKELVRIVIIKVMHYTIGELCSENFPLFWPLHYEARRRFWLIPAVPQIIAKTTEICVQIPLELCHIRLTALVNLSAHKSSVKVKQQCVFCQMICHFYYLSILFLSPFPCKMLKLLNSTHGEAVEAVVVVLRIHTARIEVQVTAIRSRIKR